MAHPTSVGEFLRAPKTAELIATHLRRQIVRGEVKLGETLPPEPDLMAQYGVSRPTLREALRILEAESLIYVRRGARGGPQVTAPELSVAARHVGLFLQMQGTTIADVYEARTALEPICARLLAERRTNQDLVDLRACVEDLHALVLAGEDRVPDPRAWGEQTYRFHELVLQRSGNKTLAVQGGVLQDIVAKHLSETVARSFDDPASRGPREQRFNRTRRSYLKLIDLVEVRDHDGAERHWRNHMDAAQKYVLSDDLKNKSVVDLFG